MDSLAVAGVLSGVRADYLSSALLTVALIAVIVLAYKWPRLRIHQRMAGAPASKKARSAMLAFAFLILLIVWTDWPGGLEDVLWRDHALLSGTLTSILLLGAGLLLFDAESERRRAARRRDIFAMMRTALEGAKESLTRAVEIALDPNQPSDSGVGAIDLMSFELRMYLDEVNHWVLASYVLDGDDLAVAHVLAGLRKEALRIVETLPPRPPSMSREEYLLALTGADEDWARRLCTIDDLHQALSQATDMKNSTLATA